MGCPCGWPIDSCNPKYAKGKPCGKEKHEMRVHRQGVKDGLEEQAKGYENRARLLRDAAALIKVPDA